VGWHSKDVARAAALVMAMYLGVQLLWFANQLVLVCFLGVLFGLAVEAGVDKLERFKIRRGIGAALIVITFFALLAGFGAWLTPTIREQSVELRAKIPEAVDRIEQWLNKRQSGFFGFMFGGQGANAGADTTALTSTDSARARAGATLDTAKGGADSNRVARAAPDSSRAAQGGGGTPSASETLRSSLGRQLGGASRFLFPFLTHTVAVFGGIMLIIFMSIYIAADPDLYHRGMMHLFPHRIRDRAGDVLSAMAIVLRRWLVTQLIAMLVIGAVTTTALLILRVKAAFALGLIAGLLEFIPTVGPILSAAPAIAMGFLDSPEKALTVALVYVGVQFMENHLLIPLLMKGGVDVPPVLTILGQALMTLVFGFLGLMVAVPMLAATMVAVKMLYIERVVGDEIAVVNKDEGPGAGEPPRAASSSSG
jgi:predicted PurR-regulated permease PerM